MIYPWTDLKFSLLDFGVSEVRRLPNQREKMRSMILCQDRLPLDMFCLPIDATPTNEMIMIERPSNWIPVRPRNMKLPRTGFTRSIRQYGQNSYLSQGTGPPGYIISAMSLAKRTFCVLPQGSEATGHAEVTLPSLPHCSTEHSVKLYLFFATVSGHPLLRDTKHYGSCFMVQKTKEDALTIRYVCSLTFNQCWQTHTESDTDHPVFPAQQVREDVSVKIDLGKPNLSCDFLR